LILQAAGFALLAAASPAALLVSAVYLGAARPHRALLIYLAGALTTTVVVAIVLLLLIHAGGLNHPHQRQPRYGVRLGLGVLALAVSLLIARRKPKPTRPDKKPGPITRMMTNPAPIATFAVGLLLFTPSVAFIAAVQVIATAKASDAAIAVALLVVILIDVMLAWLPLVLYLAAPDATRRGLNASNSWLKTHSHTITVTLLAVVGVLLVGNGAYGLAT
jgi:Sap, sulfolipid-1-addressing protein